MSTAWPPIPLDNRESPPAARNQERRNVAMIMWCGATARTYTCSTRRKHDTQPAHLLTGLCAVGSKSPWPFFSALLWYNHGIEHHVPACGLPYHHRIWGAGLQARYCRIFIVHACMLLGWIACAHICFSSAPVPASCHLAVSLLLPWCLPAL